MRWLILFALLPAFAHADGIIMCKAGATDGAALGKCTTQACAASIPADALVRTHIDPAETHIWRKWSSLGTTASVRGCASWTTKNVLAPQITVTAAGPPVTPPVTPPVVVRIPTDVGVGTRIGWTGSPEAVAYRVYRRKASASEWEAPVPTDKTFLFMSDMEPGTDYVFAVSAVGASDTETAKSEPRAYKTGAEAVAKDFTAMTCTAPVKKKVGDVTQVISTCTLQ